MENTLYTLSFLNTIPIKYFGLSSFLFLIGALILILNRSNFIKILLGFELMVLSSIMNFNLFSSILEKEDGITFIFIILAVCACEASIGLAIFLRYFKNNKNIDIDQINSLKG